MMFRMIIRKMAPLAIIIRSIILFSTLSYCNTGTAFSLITISGSGTGSITGTST